MMSCGDPPNWRAITVRRALQQYHVPATFYHHYQFQFQLKCCGADGAQDWQDSLFNGQIEETRCLDWKYCDSFCSGDLMLLWHDEMLVVGLRIWLIRWRLKFWVSSQNGNDDEVCLFIRIVVDNDNRYCWVLPFLAVIMITLVTSITTMERLFLFSEKLGWWRSRLLLHHNWPFQGNWDRSCVDKETALHSPSFLLQVRWR